jgi:hypothetical protein
MIPAMALAAVRERMRDRLQLHEIAALYGRNWIQLISKPMVTPGRATPAGKPDSALSGYLMPGVVLSGGPREDVVSDSSLFYKVQFVRLAAKSMTRLIQIFAAI